MNGSSVSKSILACAKASPLARRSGLCFRI
jgi:hypothetical protein